MKVRAGEADRSWFRSERFIHTSDGWYFMTRENTQEGPYRSITEAENELAMYIRMTIQADQFSNA
ncbi:conserved hypothetical protein [Hahella chejuensis KCTC 2396]|uniref:DUF6316 domain-containing protein n=1 Tax=Hahella chejuensis (strain KCTC 2396) TaxID=349521 RepID=Q2S8S2_HAHCH|nr:DUF6316 family protein [Hahella chejuensis]ABC32952.1 conserved hypothetical protein [Hahella chejuensis KCTC 2396]